MKSCIDFGTFCDIIKIYLNFGGITMVKHMIIWSLKDEISDKTALANEIKNALEGLVGKIDGLLEMKIITCGLPSSSGDLMMDSTFKDADSLKFYATHPEHVKVADGLVRPNVSIRSSYDYEV